MEPYNNSFCKIYPGLWCAVRNKDKTIKFITKKDTKVYKWACIVTAIEPLIEKGKSDENNIKKVFLGDENGYLHIMEIEYDSQQNDKHFFVKSIQITQSIKAHNSLIRGIIYSEKLNIVISWSDEGVISINNDTGTVLDEIDNIQEEYSLSYINNLKTIIPIIEDIIPTQSIEKNEHQEIEDIVSTKIENTEKKEYQGVEAFNVLKALSDNTDFIIKDKSDIIAKKLNYYKSGLSTSSIRENIKVQINNKIERFSLDYMRNSALVILV